MFALEMRGVKGKEAEEEALKYLAMVDLVKFADHYPKELSGGMKQRVAIARAYAANPEVLLMDEPFGALDEMTREQMNMELLEIWEKTGKTIIFITHNIEEAVYLGQRIMILTNKPTTVKETVDNNMPRPRDIAAPEFIDLRNRVTERIKWW